MYGDVVNSGHGISTRFKFFYLRSSGQAVHWFGLCVTFTREHCQLRDGDQNLNFLH